MNLKSLIRDIPDFPEPGIIFRDVTPLFQSPQGFRYVIDTFVERYRSPAYQIDAIVGIDARGFICASTCAYLLNLPLVLIRKKGKLPHTTLSHNYTLEYGENTLEIHTDAFCEGSRVLVIDDLLATGGTALASCELIKKLGGTVVEIATIIELGFLQGRQMLAPTPVYSQIVY
jgi:adenine phosphoribosyltransferase